MPSSKEKELTDWIKKHYETLEKIWAIAYAGGRIPKVKEVEAE